LFKLNKLDHLLTKGIMYWHQDWNQVKGHYVSSFVSSGHVMTLRSVCLIPDSACQPLNVYVCLSEH